MSFEKLKRDLTAYDGRSAINLDERLALFHSLESELTELTGRSLENCVLTEQDCEAGSVVSNMAWFGNLFHKLYSKNQATVENYSGRVIRRFLNDADSAADSLEKEYQELQKALEKKKETESQNASLEKEIAALRLEMNDLDKVKLRYFELTELKKQEEERFAKLSPYDLDGVQKEINAIRQKITDTQISYEKQKERMNNDQAKCRQELDEWTAKVSGLNVNNNQLEEKISEQRKIAEDLQAQKTQLEAQLSDLGVEALRTEIRQMEADIDDFKQQREQNLQKRTQLKLDLTQAQEANESFLHNYIEPIQKELAQVQSQKETLESEYRECTDIIKDFTQKIEDTNKAIPELKNRIDAQKSNFVVVETLFSKSEAKYNKLSAQLEEKENKKKELDEKLLKLEENSRNLETQISTLEFQSIPSLNDKINELTEKQSTLTQQDEQLTLELTALQKEVEEKTQAVNELNEAREQKQNEILRLNANLDSLMKKNQELEADLQNNNPEETQQKLKKENARLLEALQESEALSTALAEKKKAIEDQIKKNEELSDDISLKEKTYVSLQETCSWYTKRLEEMKDSGYLDELDKLQIKQEFLFDVFEALRSLKNQILPNTELQNESDIIRQAILTLGKQLDGLQNQLITLRDKFKENVL